MKIIAVVATDENNGIGINNQLLCHLPDDLKYFKQLTSGHVILMGRKTFESIGKPLPNRINIVLSKQKEKLAEDVFVFSDSHSAIKYIQQNYPDKNIFVIGGGAVYQLLLNSFDEVHRTLIHHVFHADTFFPDISKDFTLESEKFHSKDEKHLYDFTFQIWKRKI